MQRALHKWREQDNYILMYGQPNGQWLKSINDYDYDADYLENGMAYLIEKHTQSNKYVFGVAWIDNVGWEDEIDNENDRDVQTWFAADPTIL